MQRFESLFPCWAALTEQQQTRLLDVMRPLTFPKSEMINQGTDDCLGLLLVDSGQLRAFIMAESGREVTLYRLLAGDVCLFSASCIMPNINYTIFIETEKETATYLIPAYHYQELMRTSLAVSEYTNALMAQQFSMAMWTMEQTLFSNFDSRLAAFLIEQSAIEQSDMLPLTHDEIARHIGSAREVVSRMLQYFQSEGLVQLQRGKVFLANRKKLRALCAQC